MSTECFIKYDEKLYYLYDLSCMVTERRRTESH